jgi:hypothetical protein
MFSLVPILVVRTARFLAVHSNKNLKYFDDEEKNHAVSSPLLPKKIEPLVNPQMPHDDRSIFRFLSVYTYFHHVKQYKACLRNLDKGRSWKGSSAAVLHDTIHRQTSVVGLLPGLAR